MSCSFPLAARFCSLSLRRLRSLFTCLTLCIVVAPIATLAEPQPLLFAWDLPLGFPTPFVPDDNPMSWEKVELGRLLFYDTRMSGNQTQACASCHAQGQAFTDGLAHAVGSTGEIHPRGSMSLTNVAYGSTLGWANNLLERLEEQAPVPMFGEAPVELGLAGLEDVLLERLAAVPFYRRMLAEAFPEDLDPISLGNLVKSVATFQRTLLSGNTPFDRWLFGDDDALTPGANRGLDMFFDERFECFHCHGGFNFSAALTENNQEDPERPFISNGLYNLRCSDFGLPPVDLVRDPFGVIVAVRSDFGCYPPTNTGLFEVSTIEEHMGAFKPPTLRNICETAPYMHDGSIATLEEVIDHYAAGGRTITEGPFAGDGSRNPLKGSFVIGFNITPQEKSDLIEFLCSLTDDEFLTNPKFSDPFPGTACPGDCDFSGAIGVNELVTQVNISLEDATLAACLSADADLSGTVAVNEIIRSVGTALDGCPGS
jgi:cytochrome c peroxidase